MLPRLSHKTDSSVRVMGPVDGTTRWISPSVDQSLGTPRCRARSTNSSIVRPVIIQTPLFSMRSSRPRLNVEIHGWLAMLWGRHKHEPPHRLRCYSKDRVMAWYCTLGLPWSPLGGCSEKIGRSGFQSQSDFHWLWLTPVVSQLLVGLAPRERALTRSRLVATAGCG